MGRAARNRITGLTEKETTFAIELVRRGDGARAYRAAYDAQNMTQSAVWTEVKRLLDNPTLAAKVAELQAIADKKLAVSVERIALELARIAFFDVRELFDDEGRPVPISDLPEDVARVIAGLDVESLFEGRGEDREQVGVVRKYKLPNKIQALEVLAKWKKMLIDRSEVGKPGEFEKQTTEELEQEARELLQNAIKGGFVKALPRKRA